MVFLTVILLNLIILVLSSPLFAVDINIANAEELARELSGVGAVKAQYIVEYRKKIGGFVSIEQLMEVKGIGAKTLERNRNRIEISALSHTPPLLIDISPKIEKPSQPVHFFLWDALIIIPLLLGCLLIFAAAWFKSASKDQSVPRKHLVSTTFICSGCGNRSEFKNVRYEGHFSEQYVDDRLPSGWSCIRNWLGKPCDYCSDCSQKRYRSQK